MTETILLTGGTGFLGTEIAENLIDKPDLKIYVLLRAEDDNSARLRLKSVWYHNKALCESIGRNVIPVRGDFTKEKLGLEVDDYNKLQESVTLVIHSGAQIDFSKSKKDLDDTNITGTANMIEFAKGISNLRRFVYISTAYVSGTREGIIVEDEQVGASFSSQYEKSKAAAEGLVRASGLPVSVCRPGMIVGDSVTGWVRSFNTIYYVLKQILTGKLSTLPIKKNSKLNIVPVDYVAKSVVKVALDEKESGKTYHLTCPIDKAPTAYELTEHVREWAGVNIGVDIPKTRFISVPALKKVGLKFNSSEKEMTKSYVNNLFTLMPYFYDNKVFDKRNTDALCGDYEYDWKQFIDRLLEFACKKNFMKQTGHTVFEQAYNRRASKRYPMNFMNISVSGIETVPGPEVNSRIDRIYDALWALGVRKGDKVALTGINSVEYLALEQAIGLMGAVSVPIYYTSPAKETSLLLEKSGARWFFIGDNRMMEQVNMIETDAQIITFSVADNSSANVRIMKWNAFLNAADSHAPKQHVDPDDLATIRYTSGTTGDPKGVMFSFGQLAWMGEVLTNLIDFTERNRSLRYLSFLPLSHVVEGILAAYAPYYMLAKVDYYYLNDFGMLTRALPKVKPTVFFSVPRFYEKVWDQAISNHLGRLWLECKDGTLKNILGSLLKSVVLKKAGIDKCKQLLVGSAPISANLLYNFRKLGVEVYNAYGQTEAPLISLNRIGDNVIPTIGTPLPETKVSLMEDGELLVTGPQVALGYYGLDNSSVEDGVLKTGDIGSICDNGHIMLHGRKKDFIVTAYGKNISISKLEGLLKDIPGISEAVLIGESRPYCTALLWSSDKLDTEYLDNEINEMNEKLSHPEQIRKYKIIDRALSIQNEELTPNLKVKRGNVEMHFMREIEEMYS